MPAEKAQAVYAVYAFCRMADDSIDEAETKEEQAKALGKLKNWLRKFEEGDEPNHPIWRALRDVFNRYRMSITPFYDQLQGQMMDYYFKQPRTIEEVKEYSYYVAGSVGLMLLPILATEHHYHLEESAVSLGIAMQLTNILRDVGEDFREKNRIYLPEDLMVKVGYSAEDLEHNRINDSFVVIWEKMAVTAEQLFVDFRKSVHLFDPDSQFPVVLSSKVYAAIINTVRENNYDCLTKRNHTSLLKKLCLYNEAKKEWSIQ